MIVIDYSSVLSKHGSGQRLHSLSGVGIVLGGLWVVLKLEWNPLHPWTFSIESCGDLPSFYYFKPHLHLFLFLSFCSGFFLGSGDGCFAWFSFVFRVSYKFGMLVGRIVI